MLFQCDYAKFIKKASKKASPIAVHLSCCHAKIGISICCTKSNESEQRTTRSLEASQLNSDVQSHNAKRPVTGKDQSKQIIRNRKSLLSTELLQDLLEKTTMKAIDKCYHIVLDNQPFLQNIVFKHSSSGIQLLRPQGEFIEPWSFTDSVLFTFTVITTIGYGNVAPRTFEADCFVFAMVLCDKSSTIDEEEEESSNETISLLLMFIVYIFGGSFLLSIYEPDMTFFKLYFNFVSLTSIGLGDVVPQSESYMVITLLYIAVGLALTTIAIEIFADTLKKLHYFGRKIENAPPIEPEDLELDLVNFADEEEEIWIPRRHPHLEIPRQNLILTLCLPTYIHLEPTPPLPETAREPTPDTSSWEEDKRKAYSEEAWRRYQEYQKQWSKFRQTKTSGGASNTGTAVAGSSQAASPRSRQGSRLLSISSDAPTPFISGNPGGRPKTKKRNF
uniref:Potassium channel domain-containing protein n=1 Tax=Ditylenchus dipsaci TaxID=166011 RepID=A0A915CRQ4_9BILA